MGKSSGNQFVIKKICWTVSIFVCLIAGMMAKTGIEAIFANKGLADCYVPLGLALFMIIGLIGTRWVIRKTNADIKREKEMKRLHPDQPWFWQAKWADGKMTSSNKHLVIIQILGAGVFSLVGWTGLIICLPDIIEGDYVKLLAAFFPLVGLIMGYYALCYLSRYRKFGESTFQMACVPGIVGGELAGVIHTKASRVPDGGFVLKLQSIKSTTTGSGKHRSTRHEVLWEDTHKVSVDLGAGDGMVVLPVTFAIPFECEPCSEKPNENPKLNWKLSANAKFPGADFHCEFDVPVFKTPDSQVNFKAEIAEESLTEEIPLANLLAASGVTQANDNGKISFEFPLARRFGAKLSFLLTTIFFAGGVFLMPIVFGILTLLLAAGTIRCWCWYGKISADEQGVQILTGFLGLRSHQFSRDQIKSLIYRETMNNQTQEFDLLVETTEHEKPTLFGTALQGESAARRLCEALESVLAMPSISKKVGRKEHLPNGFKVDAMAGIGAKHQTPHGA